jgi:hypothetical protein
VTPKEEAHLKEEILKTGFPLELATAEALRWQGYTVSTNVYYTDEDEAVGRELDILGIKLEPIQSAGPWAMSIETRLVVECKKSEKHWVVFSSEENDADAPVLVAPRMIDYLVRNNQSFSIDSVITRSFGRLPDRGQRLGRTYSVIHGSGDDSQATIRAALLSTLKCLEREKAELFSGTARLVLGFPLIVLRGKLVEAYLIGADLQVREVSSIYLSVEYMSAVYSRVRRLIPIVTEPHLPAFLADVAKGVDRAAEVFCRAAGG